MQDDASVRIRIAFEAREIDLAGPVAAVNAYLDRFEPLLRLFESECAGSQPNSPKARTSDTALALSRAADASPEEFGEYLHRLPASLSGNDMVLAAGKFVQQCSSENSFATADVSTLLTEQGVRIANTSQAVRRNVQARMAYPVSGGRYRVSREGMLRLQLLEEADTARSRGG